MDRFAPPLILALLMVMLALATGCADQSDSNTSKSNGQEGVPPGKLKVTDNAVPEANLVSIDDETPIVEKRKVRRYGHLLDLLGETCTDSRTQLSDYSVFSTQQLDKKGGIQVSNFDVLKAVQGSIPPEAQKQRCRDLFAAFITLRLQEP